MTPFSKFVLPVVVGGASGWLTIMSFRDPGPVVYPGLVAFLRWLVVGVCVAGTLYSVQLAVRLRRVRIDQSGVLVSNYREEIHVPFAAIADVTYEIYGFRAVYVTLTFHETTPLGRRAVFVPPLGTHPRAFVNELRRNAGLSTTRHTTAPAV